MGEDTLRLVEAPDQKEAPDLEIASMGGVYVVAVLLERRPRCLQRLRGPTQIARGECDLRLGDHAPRVGHRLFSTEGTRSTSQESVRSSEITELRHGDAPKCESRRILAQGDALQCAEGITHRERSRRGRDQRVHKNPAILVTPTVRHAVLIYLTTTNKHVVCED